MGEDFSDLKAGDPVLVRHTAISRESYTSHTVKHVTATGQIVLDNDERYRSNGDRIKKYERWQSHEYLHPYDGNLVQQQQENDQYNTDCSFLTHYSWNRLPRDIVRDIAAKVRAWEAEQSIKRMAAALKSKE